MVQASSRFHEAVYANPSNKQAILFDFGETLFTNEDIDVSAGVKLSEQFNPETDLTVGACTSSTIKATALNYNGLLANFAFGECAVSLGVSLGTTDKATDDGASCTSWLFYGADNEKRLTGHSETPYLRVDGEACSLQPEFPVLSIAVDGDVIRCIGETSAYILRYVSGTWEEVSAYTWTGISDEEWGDVKGKFYEHTPSVAANAFMLNKMAGWAQEKLGILRSGQYVYVTNTSGTVATVETYEYVKLGVFSIDKPERVKIDMLELEGFDRMTNFDVSATDFLSGVAYPITVANFLSELCEHVNVPYNYAPFINSGRILYSEPPVTNGMTCRELLKWIAEAGCSFARIGRDGALEIAWFNAADITLDEDSYFDAVISEYQVSQIDKLIVKNSQSDYGSIIGTGTNAYVITDNGILYGDTDAAIRTAASPIYDRLAAYAEITPCAVSAVCDWSIQAGDIITLSQGDETYALPIYAQEITWAGVATVEYESSGEKFRPVETAENRRVYNQNKATHELVVNVESLTSRITDDEGDISTINQTIDEIELSVVRKDGVIAAINLSPETGVSIEAEKISLEGLVTANSYFKINTDGSMEAAAGKIANWTIGQNALYTDGNALYLGTSAIEKSINGTNRNVVFSAGSSFGVDSSGNLYSSGGEIAGWTIGQNALHTANNALYLGNISVTKDINGTSRSVVFSAGSNFGVGSDGTLYASNAVLSGEFSAGTGFSVTSSGEITATSGTIGGLNISSNQLSWNEGNDYIRADGYGQLGLMSYTPDSASFDGKISAKNIRSGTVDGVNHGRITGGSGGQIDVGTITGDNLTDDTVAGGKILLETGSSGIVYLIGSTVAGGGSGKVLKTCSNGVYGGFNLSNGVLNVTSEKANLLYAISSSQMKAYLTGVSSSDSTFQSLYFDTGVFLSTTSGNLTATSFTGALSGNASTATALQTSRTITIGSLGQAFDGSSDISWTVEQIGAVDRHPGTSYSGKFLTVGANGYTSWADSTISSHTHGNITYEGKIGSTTGMVVVTGADGTLTTTTPSTLSVGYATSAGSASNATNASYATNAGSASAAGSASSAGSATYASQLSSSVAIVIGGQTKYFNGASGITYDLATMGAVNRNQGSANSGKYLTVGSDGYVTLTTGGGGGTSGGNADAVYTESYGFSKGYLTAVTTTGTGYKSLVFNSGLYAEIVSGAGSFLYATLFIGDLNGNANTATKLATARTLTIGNTGKSFDGSGAVSWTLNEIGAVPINQGSSNAGKYLTVNSSGYVTLTPGGGGSIIPTEGSNGGTYLIGYNPSTQTFHYNTNVYFGTTYPARIVANSFLGDFKLSSTSGDGAAIITDGVIGRAAALGRPKGGTGVTTASFVSVNINGTNYKVLVQSL